MKKIDQIIQILFDILQLIKVYLTNPQTFACNMEADEELTRQGVKDYLKISEATYKRKVKDGVIKPIKMPGGHRVMKSQLKQQYQESMRRGRV